MRAKQQQLTINLGAPETKRPVSRGHKQLKDLIKLWKLQLEKK